MFLFVYYVHVQWISVDVFGLDSTIIDVDCVNLVLFVVVLFLKFKYTPRSALISISRECVIFSGGDEPLMYPTELGELCGANAFNQMKFNFNSKKFSECKAVYRLVKQKENHPHLIRTNFLWFYWGPIIWVRHLLLQFSF